MVATSKHEVLAREELMTHLQVSECLERERIDAFKELRAMAFSCLLGGRK